MFKRLRESIEAYKEYDVAARSGIEVLLLYSGLHATINHRMAHWFYRHRRYFIARLISQMSRFFTGIEIHPGAKIGRRLVIDHGAGVVIGETTEIGDNVLIYQNVTLGGTGKDTGKRHPTIRDNVMVGCGARVLGPIVIGENCKIAANAVVLKDLPPNSTAAGVPAKVVRVAGEKVSVEEKLDHIHTPNPMDELYSRIEALEKRLAAYEREGRETFPEEKTER